MASVAGQFAGLVWVRVGAEKAGALQKDLESLEKRDLKVVVRSAGSATPRPARVLKLELLGHDRPGIVRELAKALARRNVNVEELTSETYSAPMSGDSLFKATLELGVPAEIDVEALRRDLKSVGDQLDLDVLTLEAGK
jgi:glycine cleavage system regulatory protein